METREWILKYGWGILAIISIVVLFWLTGVFDTIFYTWSLELNHGK